MKTISTLLSAAALVLAAGTANAESPILGTESIDSVAPAYHFYPKYPKIKCFYKLGFHYHWHHGFHFGWHKKCVPFYYYY